MISDKIKYAVPSAGTVKIYTLHLAPELTYLRHYDRNVEEAVVKRIYREMDARSSGHTLEQRQSYEMSLDLMGWTYVSAGYEENSFERIWWMINNCANGFTRSSTGHYWFEDPTEASFFRLQWVKTYA